MTFHPSLFPTFFVAAVSVAAAAILRRIVRQNYASILPWLMPWGILCAIPALVFGFLCLPFLADYAAWLNDSISGTGTEILAGMAGVLPGLLWDDIAERVERRRELPFGLPAALLRTVPLVALIVLILIPYFFLFNRQEPPQEPQTKISNIAETP